MEKLVIDYSNRSTRIKSLHHRSKKHNNKPFFIVFLMVLSFVAVLLTRIKNNTNTISANLNLTPTVTSHTQEINPTENSSPKTIDIASRKDLMENIQKITNKVQGTFSIYIYDLKSNTGFGINEEMIVKAASVNKIPILAVLYHIAQEKPTILDKIIVPQKEDIQDYGTGSIRYDPPNTPYSVKTLARLMMEKSDNTAAYILGSLVVGLNKIQTYTNEWNMIQTDMIKNTTSAKDISNLLIKIYRGEISNKALNAEMIGFMDDSDFEDRIPLYLPEEINIYHKTGDDIGKIHDAAIIDSENPYILTVFTTDISDEQLTKKTIGEISKLVFDYMTKSGS
jgi:beta-lactamase class A